jgi:hypothetical protein
VFTAGKRGVSIQYRVALDPALHGSAERARERSFRHARGWHLKGYQILPEIPLDAPALIYFDVEHGDEVLAALAPEAVLHAASRAFRAWNALELARSSYEIGRLEKTCARVDGINACVASSVAAGERELGAMMDLTAYTLRAASARLGELGDRYILVSHHSRGGDDAFGVTIGSSVTVLSPEPPGYAADGPGFVLVHELVHLWLPGARSIRPLWLREGLTEYLAYQIVAEVTGAGDVALVGWVNDAYRRYSAVLQDSTIAETSDEVVYPAGVVAGFCLDRELNARGSSISEVIRALLDLADDHPTTSITEDWFFSELSRVSPKVAGYFKLLLSDRKINFARCLLPALKPLASTPF